MNKLRRSKNFGALLGLGASLYLLTGCATNGGQDTQAQLDEAVTKTDRYASLYRIGADCVALTRDEADGTWPTSDIADDCDGVPEPKLDELTTLVTEEYRAQVAFEETRDADWTDTAKDVLPPIIIVSGLTALVRGVGSRSNPHASLGDPSNIKVR
ncbi:MAG TPA: hypothetical protein VF572_03875 [Candidatus Saccharimonadales bacterium]|jgi:hypothetical protein